MELSSEDYSFLYNKLDCSKIPPCIGQKLIRGEKLHGQAAIKAKQIIEEKRSVLQDIMVRG